MGARTSFPANYTHPHATQADDGQLVGVVKDRLDVLAQHRRASRMSRIAVVNTTDHRVDIASQGSEHGLFYYIPHTTSLQGDGSTQTVVTKCIEPQHAEGWLHSEYKGLLTGSRGYIILRCNQITIYFAFQVGWRQARSGLAIEPPRQGTAAASALSDLSKLLVTKHEKQFPQRRTETSNHFSVTCEFSAAKKEFVLTFSPPTLAVEAGQ